MLRLRRSRHIARIALGLAWIVGSAAAAEPPDLVRPLERAFPLSPAALEARLVLVDTRLLESGAGTLRIQLPDGQEHTVVRDGLERRGPADLVWTGRLRQAAGYNRVVISQSGRFVHALVIAPEGLYELVPAAGGRHSFERLDPDELPACGGALEAREEAGSAAGMPAARVAGTGEKSASAGDIIDVLGLYTPAARDALGGKREVEAYLQFEIDKANTALSDSQMSMRFRLVHTALESRGASKRIQANLETIRASARVARLRDAQGADLVALVAGAPRSDGCGLAYIMRAPGGDFARWGFSVTAARCGGALAHELGHNLGFEHDPQNGATPSRASYPWSFGHILDGRYRTIMAYSSGCSSGCPQALLYSNPDVRHRGESTGIAGERDNARTADLTAPIVAAFRQDAGGLFADGFDEGGTDAWDHATGSLEVVEPGLRGSSHALRITLDGTNLRSFVESRDPSKESRFDVGLYLRPDRVTLGGIEVTLLQVWGRSAAHLELTLTETGGKYRVEVYARDATGTPVHLGGAKVRANKADRVLVEWRRATGAGLADGSVRLRVNGKLKVEATALDNRRWVVGKARLGLPEGSEGAPAGGTFRLDGYASGR